MQFGDRPTDPVSSISTEEFTIRPPAVFTSALERCLTETRQIVGVFCIAGVRFLPEWCRLYGYQRWLGYSYPVLTCTYTIHYRYALNKINEIMTDPCLVFSRTAKEAFFCFLFPT